MTYPLYLLFLLGLTLGLLYACGLLIWLCSRLFSRLVGRHAWVILDITSIVGTPVHELGHALMCFPFFHRITKIRLWKPHPSDGLYGYVEHTYKKRNPWARLGNLFIGLGPLFSGLGVVVLALYLCFPAPWQDYLTHTGELVYSGSVPIRELFSGVFALFRGFPAAFRDNWVRSLAGLLVILSVCLHITLSWADVKNSLTALPVYLVLLALFSLPTYFIPRAQSAVLNALALFNVRVSALFGLCICFALCWVALGLVVRLIRTVL
mgnify:FL=1